MKFTTHFELHSQTTRLVEGVPHGPYTPVKTGFSPSMTFCSKKFNRRSWPEHPLQITTRTLKAPDFKFELLPLHSPLLRQSLLVSFPPLIDMLKFSGYPYLIRGQPDKKVFRGRRRPRLPSENVMPQRSETGCPAGDFEARGGARRPIPSQTRVVK